ncbi:unnamed protein product [Soboliphyme baturini]|uniref:RNA helicase n=1 Tax=Soboliphyme baturini TaxID=241478 RepID=A0A183IFH2_9BILA|nr:unnamed protein product [Soboliphyme baturini]
MIKEEIMNALENNQVIIVAGDPGCGKTTQVPQFIFDHYPRCLSAISVAKQVAFERGEGVGDVVGYDLRFERLLPRNPGSIVFTTPGMFLRSSLQKRRLAGISHLIIDEVHERDSFTDFTLTFIKQLLPSIPDMKVILMSATMDTDQFSRYFDDCPVVTISGRNFDVEEHFLEDILPMTGQKMTLDDCRKFLTSRQTNVGLVADLLTWISKNREVLQGLIIYAVVPLLNVLARLVNQYLEIARAPKDVRKIVLATDVAETSLSIENVRFVVNAGLRRIASDSSPQHGINYEFEWASRASQIRRKGRAGRVMDGECFHLFTRAMYEQFADRDVPQLQLCSLEYILLLTKLFFESCDPVELLKTSMDPPDDKHPAEHLLVELGAFHAGNQLTPLGRRMALLSCDPQLSRALVYANAFGDLSNSGTSKSEPFCKANSISLAGMRQFVELRKIFASEFESANESNALNLWSASNVHSNDVALIKAALMTGFYKNIAKMAKGKIRRGKSVNEECLTIIESDNSTIRQRRLSPYFQQQMELRNSWFCYFPKQFDPQSGMYATDGLTPVPALTVLLFSGYKPVLLPAPKQGSTDKARLVQLGGLRFFQIKFENERAFRIVSDLRSCIRKLVVWSVSMPEVGLKDQETRSQFETFRQELLSTLSELLQTQEVELVKKNAPNTALAQQASGDPCNTLQENLPVILRL